MKSVQTWYQNVNRTRASSQRGSLVPTWEIPKDIELSIQLIYQSEAVHEKLGRKPETSDFWYAGNFLRYVWVCVFFLGWEFGRRVNTKEDKRKKCKAYIYGGTKTSIEYKASNQPAP